MKNDSMLVLSELFSVNFTAVEPTDWCIDPVTFAMKFNQFDEYVMHQAEELQCVLDGDQKRRQPHTGISSSIDINTFKIRRF